MYHHQVMYHNQVHQDEGPTNKYEFVLKWLEAHEKYFSACPPTPEPRASSPEVTTTCLPSFQFLKKPGAKYFQRKPIPTPRVPAANIPTSSQLIVKTSNLTIQSNPAVNHQTTSNMAVHRPIQSHTSYNQAAQSRAVSRPIPMSSRPITSRPAEHQPIWSRQSEMEIANEIYVPYAAVIPPSSYRIPPPCCYTAYTYDIPM